MHFAVGLGPCAPRVIFERILSIRLEKLHELATFHVGEARADTDMFEISIIVIQAEQKRADGVFISALVPAKSGDDAVAVPLMLDLEHHSLVRLIGSSLGFRDYTVESGALESAKPVCGQASVPCCRRDMKRRLHFLQQRFESRASVSERSIAKTSITFTEQIEENDRRWNLARQFFYS